MGIALSFLMSLLSLTWSIITSLKLQIIVVPMILLDALNVESIYADKIIAVAGIIWLIVITKPIIDFIKTIITR